MVDTRKLYEVTARLETDCQQDPSIAEIYTLTDILQKNNQDPPETTKCIQTLQRINDNLYKKYGLKESILDFQVCINTLRNQYNVVDPDEEITRQDGVYVQ